MSGIKAIRDGVPFVEALAAFKKRHDNPIATARWDDLIGEAHANAFTVAGATSQSLLNDFAAAVKQTLDAGGTLNDFRKQFDTIVERHGWDYKGGRGWRAKTIFRTNSITASAAGRWDQIQQAAKIAAKSGRKIYLMYRHVGDTQVRDAHRKWGAPNPIILPADHRFWQTHYPPNGWGCRCIVVIVSERYLKARGLQATDENALPESVTEDRINTATGEIYPDQTPGIDTGWNYNVGQSYLLGSAETFGNKIMQAAPEFRPVMLTQAQTFLDKIQVTFKSWIADESLDLANNVRRPVAFLSSDLVNNLVESPTILSPGTALVTVGDQSIMRALRSKKVNQPIVEKDIEAFVEQVRSPKAILIDEQDNDVIYLLQGDRGQLIKAVIKINHIDTNGQRSNTITSAEKIKPAVLKQKRYSLLSGQI